MRSRSLIQETFRRTRGLYSRLQMFVLRFTIALFLVTAAGFPATLGTVVPYVLQNAPCEVILLREAVAISEERRSRGIEPAQIAPPSAAVVSRR